MIEVRHVGREGQPVVVVDGFAVDPDALRATAIGQPFTAGLNRYPGVRAPLPDRYWPDQNDSAAAAIAAIAGDAGPPRLIDASFSIVTLPRDALAVGQRLPHCDAFEANRIAFVHYLAHDGGGTGFYRHRSTGFETIDARRATIFDGQLDAELRYGGPPPADYVGDDDRLFERIATVEARYNRAVFYRSFLLHSGVIEPDASLSADPASGRLTVTGFLSL